ncbi:MAG: hypothetical protein KDA48_14130 [Amphiplicatus sp.]|nr:hypothetical protein [Amphiplicatus sp.]
MSNDPLNTVIDYSEDAKLYQVHDADSGDFLFSEPTLSKAWDELKDECERRGVTMGDCDYRNRGPDKWDDTAR